MKNAVHEENALDRTRRPRRSRPRFPHSANQNYHFRRVKNDDPSGEKNR